MNQNLLGHDITGSSQLLQKTKAIELVTVELGFQLETQIPVCDLASLPRFSRLHSESRAFMSTFPVVDGWQWIWLTAHRVLLGRSRNSKVNFKLVVCGFGIELV